MSCSKWRVVVWFHVAIYDLIGAMLFLCSMCNPYGPWDGSLGWLWDGSVGGPRNGSVGGAWDGSLDGIFDESLDGSVDSPSLTAVLFILPSFAILSAVADLALVDAVGRVVATREPSVRT